MRTFLASLAVGLLAIGCATGGPVAGRTIVIDVADQTKSWSNLSTRGESYYLKAELQNRGSAYTNADLTGYLWYASNSLSTVGVLIPSYTTETSGVWFYLSATNTLGLSTNAEAYFAQIILTNRAATLMYDWRQGQFVTRHGGGITGTGTTPATGIMNWDVISNIGTLPWSGMSATNVAWDNVTGKPSIWPGSATDATARADALLGITNAVYGAQDGPSVAGRVLTIGTNKFSGGTSGSGTSDHAALSNLAWTASGHTGTPARLAGFFEGGAAGYGGFGAGVYLDGSDNIAVSNDIITGAAAGATALQPANTSGWVVASHAGFLTNAWQNPASATNWTWMSDGNEITLTGYTGPNDVVIPDLLDGLPVTGFGTVFSPALAGTAITSISEGLNIASIANNAFRNCTSLTNATLYVSTIAAGAFYGCSALVEVQLPNAKAFPTLVGSSYAFRDCPSLTSAFFEQNAPAETANVFLNSTNVSVYVTSPTATGWGATWNGRPVVRLPVYGSIAYSQITNPPSIPTQASDIGAVSNNPAGIAAAGGLTNAVVKAIATYSTTNPVITLSEGVNAWNWTPATNVTLSPTFSGPGAGWAGSGMLRLVRTNNDNTVTWPTNAVWFVNGTRTTNAPALLNYNRIVVDYFDTMWTLGLVSTNAAAL